MKLQTKQDTTHVTHKTNKKQSNNTQSQTDQETTQIKHKTEDKQNKTTKSHTN